MTVDEILMEIKPLGKESYRKVMLNHGVPEPIFGVKIEDLKKIQKRIKRDYQLSKDLFDTGIYDAMYLAGLIADDLKMSKKDLTKWVENAHCRAISEYTVPWVAAESNHGWELGRKWIDSKKAKIASTGWATLASLVAVTDDDDLDLPELKKLLDRVGKTIHDQPDRVKYVMNSFVIAVGTYVKSLTAHSLKTAAKIGKLSIDMGNTSCKVPNAAEYINKVKTRNSIGKKRKSTKC